ncbi:MAG: hypothetical protein ACKOPK_17805, partial [Dolichospermum sp.]
VLLDLPSRTKPDLSRDNIEISLLKPEQDSSFPDILLSEIAPLKDAYIEDNELMEREIASLKLPTRRFNSKTIARGTIIGVEKTRTIQDLAIVRTLLEASKFKKIRQKNAPNNSQKVKILPTDLYRYRRAPVAEQMLMLLLDYTCLE